MLKSGSIRYRSRSWPARLHESLLRRIDVSQTFQGEVSTREAHFWMERVRSITSMFIDWALLDPAKTLKIRTHKYASIR